MQLQTILNRIAKFKSFVYRQVRWAGTATSPTLIVTIVGRANSRSICSGCHKPAPRYDRGQTRRFEYVPMWGISVFFEYARWRVHCCRCGVRVEVLPWAEGKNTLTTTYMHFLAAWARRLSWKEVAEVFRTSWGKVFRSVQWMVQWGLAHRDVSDVTSIGVDEVLVHRGHKFATVVYQIDEHRRRLLWVGRHRTVKTFMKFFREFGKENTQRLRFICSDMWKPYLKVIAKKASGAIHVLDRFHIMMHMNKAIDEVRAQEVKALKAKNCEPILTHSRWCLLKRKENLTAKQVVKLKELLQYNLKVMRSYLLKEQFQFFWEYTYPFWAGEFLDQWCRQVMRSKIEPMKKVARMLRAHRGLLLNWFRARKKISSGAIEGLNAKLKLTMRKSYGFRTYETLEVALYHTLGDLPEPEFTHRFW